MKSIAVLAIFANAALAALSAGCTAPTPDEPLDDERTAEEAAVSAEQSIIDPIPDCDDGTVYETKLQSCLGGSQVKCIRECYAERHWSILQQQCVIDSKTCAAWLCPICPP